MMAETKPDWPDEVLDPPTVRALLDEVEGLRARLDEAYPRALQAAAGVVFRYDLSSAVLDMEDEDDVAAAMDALADDILELSAEQIEAYDAKVDEAAQVAEHYVCPGCHVVGEEPCLPGCIDAEIEGERRRPFDGFSEFNADDGDDEGDEPEEGGTP